MKQLTFFLKYSEAYFRGAQKYTSLKYFSNSQDEVSRKAHYYLKAF